MDPCPAVRNAVGADFPLSSDSPDAFDYAETVRMGRALHDRLAWHEDPLPVDDLYGYVRLEQQLHIPLMAAEMSGGGLTALAAWVVERASDVLSGDDGLKGGIHRDAQDRAPGGGVPPALRTARRLPPCRTASRSRC